MSTTTERILIAILLIVAVVFAMRDAHSGIFAACVSYAGSPRYDYSTNNERV